MKEPNDSGTDKQAKRYLVEIEGETFEVFIPFDETVPISVAKGKSRFKCNVNVNSHPDSFTIEQGGIHKPVRIEKSDNVIMVRLGCRSTQAVVKSERDLLLEKFSRNDRLGKSHSNIISPLHGLGIIVQKTNGAQAKKGESIVIIEAMKMENEIRVPHDCVIKEIKVKEGQTIDKGHVIALLE